MAIGAQVQLEPGDHIVQFYEREHDLVATVGSHLAQALLSGDAAIVVATTAHRDAFASHIAGAGADVVGARASGTLVELDAEDTLAEFMVAGAPNAEAFDSVVGDAVRRAGEAGRRVRAYGEMVALLWDAGQVTAAIDLEELWNRLMERHSFSLFCAYPAHLVEGDEHTDALATVCHLHSAVVGSMAPRAARERFAGTLLSARAARRFVAQTLHAWGRDELIGDAELVIGELATNAVVHCQSDFDVTITQSGGGVRMTVRDDSRSKPIQKAPDCSVGSGRGLTMVAAVASRWGCDVSDDGKQVWVDLKRRN
jgi:anti-sigma regulatory factor (Ser/Thr protein kinase)